MSHRSTLSLIGLLALLSAGPAGAQSTHAFFGSATISLGRPQAPSASLLPDNGFGQHLRLGYRLRPQLAATLDFSNLVIGRNDVILAAPCAPPGCSSSANFLGPVRVATAGLGLHRSTALGRSQLAVTGGPALAWFYDRPQGAASTRLSFAGAAQFALGTGGRVRPLAEVEYRYFVGTGRAVESVLSFGIGLELP